MEKEKIVVKEQRSALLHCRIKGSILNLLNEKVTSKQKVTKGKVSQADIIEAALLFYDGNIFAAEAIEKSKERLKKGEQLVQSSKQLLIDGTTEKN